jgi:hypothetical protein
MPKASFAQPRQRVVPLECLMDDRNTHVAIHLGKQIGLELRRVSIDAAKHLR